MSNIRLKDNFHVTGSVSISGNLGIGTTEPAQALEVAGTNPQILIAESATEFVRIGVEESTHNKYHVNNT